MSDKKQNDDIPTIQTGKVTGGNVNIGGNQTFHGDVSIQYSTLN